MHLGDIYPTRDNPSRVLHKLGYGSFATFWLAKDIVANRCVVLKTVIARLSRDKGEAALLKWLSARPRDHPEANHLVQLHNSFQIHGPNEHTKCL
ncbi:hypothetical protein M405DRAFT_870203 [Rhizopogon salebrosus TDB-379]|nr:hypothetical protein M405DRAFT_870203 [Rhizopogon salebrosus TDB-379]